MFHYLRGIVTEIKPGNICIECSGIGFDVNISLQAMSRFSIGEETKVYITEIVKDDAFDLFGFADKTEQRCFDLLISVSGIGPKAAMAILSANTPDMLILAVSTGNEKALVATPGIGKKTAQRVILELKDKFSGLDAGLQELNPSLKDGSAAPSSVSGTPALNDAVEALSMLGYSSSDYASILKSLKLDGMTSEQIIKIVLKHMV